MTKSWLRSTGVLASAMVLISGGALSAHAAASPRVYAANSAGYTQYFDRFSDGRDADQVWVCDTSRDGHGVIGWIEVQQADGSYDAKPRIYAGRGINTCEVVTQDVLREASRIRVHSCVVDGRYGRPYGCSYAYVTGS